MTQAESCNAYDCGRSGKVSRSLTVKLPKPTCLCRQHNVWLRDRLQKTLADLLDELAQESEIYPGYADLHE